MKINGVPLNKKQSKMYLFFRVYAIISILIWNACGIWEISHASSFDYTPYFIPVILPSVFMMFNLMAFRFEYSIFGQTERTPFPDEPRLQQHIGSGGIAWMSAHGPLINWILFPSGIGFNAYLVGKGFISLAEIVKTRKRFLFGYAIYHHSAEVRSPLTFYSARIYVDLVSLCKQKGIRADLAEP